MSAVGGTKLELVSGDGVETILIAIFFVVKVQQGVQPMFEVVSRVDGLEVGGGGGGFHGETARIARSKTRFTVC